MFYLLWVLVELLGGIIEVDWLCILSCGGWGTFVRLDLSAFLVPGPVTQLSSANYCSLFTNIVYWSVRLGLLW